MDRRTFLLYSSLLGLTLPFLPPKTVKACQKKWKKLGKISLERVEYVINGYRPYDDFVAWTKSHVYDYNVAIMDVLPLAEEATKLFQKKAQKTFNRILQYNLDRKAI